MRAFTAARSDGRGINLATIGFYPENLDMIGLLFLLSSLLGSGHRALSRKSQVHRHIAATYCKCIGTILTHFMPSCLTGSGAAVALWADCDFRIFRKSRAHGMGLPGPRPGRDGRARTGCLVA